MKINQQKTKYGLIPIILAGSGYHLNVKNEKRWG